MLGFITTIIISLAVSLISYSIVQDKLINGVWGAIPLGIIGSSKEDLRLFDNL